MTRSTTILSVRHQGRVAIGGEMRRRVDQLIGAGNLQLRTSTVTTTSAGRGNGRSRPR